MLLSYFKHDCCVGGRKGRALMVRSGKVLSTKGLSSHQNMNVYQAMCHFYMTVSVCSTIYCIPDFFSLLSKAECTGFVLVLGKPVQLSLAAEEVATFYAKMLDHEYTTKETFQNNFFTDWKEVRSSECQQFVFSPRCLIFSGFAVRKSLLFIRCVCPTLSLGNDRRWEETNQEAVQVWLQ